MNSSKIEKIYPELKGLSRDEQNNILRKAMNENFRVRKFLILGPRLYIGCIGMTVLIHLILSSNFGPYSWAGTLIFIIVIGLCLSLISKRNQKYLKSKVRELAQDKI